MSFCLRRSGPNVFMKGGGRSLHGNQFRRFYGRRTQPTGSRKLADAQPAPTTKMATPQLLDKLNELADGAGDNASTMRRRTDLEQPGEEWQQYASSNGRFFYQHLRTEHVQWEMPACGYYPVGTGVDVSPGMNLLRGDKLSANPYKKPGKLILAANAFAIGCCLYTAYVYFTGGLSKKGNQQQ